MAGFKMNIVSSTGDVEEITFDNYIKSVKFKMNTINDNMLNHDQNIRAELVVVGELSSKSKTLTKKLAQWAMTCEASEVYRDVKIEVFNGTSNSAEKLRTYEIKEMFVLDYEEFVGESDVKDESGTAQEEGKFVMFLAQNKANSNRMVSEN